MKMRQRLTREERRDETRKRLMAAARVAFLEQGFARTSLDQICEDAGYTKGALYSNFSGKEDIFLALLEEKLAADREAAASIFSDARSLSKALDALHAYLSGRPDILQFTAIAVEFLSGVTPGSESADRCAVLYRQQREGIAFLLQQQALGAGVQLPDDPMRLAAGFVALTLGLAAQVRLDPSAGGTGIWADVCVDYVRRSLE